MAESTDSEEVSVARERMNLIASNIKEKMHSKIVDVLAGYGVAEETAATIADTLHAAYQTISIEVHKEVMGI